MSHYNFGVGGVAQRNVGNWRASFGGC